MGDGTRTPEQLAAEKIGHISEAAKNLLRAGLDEKTAHKILATSFPDYAGAFGGLSAPTKKQLEPLYEQLKKSKPALTLTTRAGRFEVIRKAANAHGVGDTESARIDDYLMQHQDLYPWYRAGAEGGESEIETPVKKSQAQKTVQKRCMERLDKLSRDLMATNPALDYANAMDKTCMSAEGAELYQLYADAWSDRTVAEFAKTLTDDCPRFSPCQAGQDAQHRSMLAKRLREI